MEDLIRSLPGVEGVRIVLDDWGAVREIHVLADSSRSPKAIARDIESSLQARWGLVIDHRRISIAQLEEKLPQPRWVRLRLQQLAITNDPIRGRVEVAVSLAPEPPRDALGRKLGPEVPAVVWQGRAAGHGAQLGMRLAGEATLQALNQTLLPEHSFHLADVGRFAMGAHEVVVSLLHYRAPRGVNELVTGSALVRSEPVEAAVRAVLSGTNRLFGIAVRWQALFEEPPGDEEEEGEQQAAAAGEAGAEGASPLEDEEDEPAEEP